MNDLRSEAIYALQQPYIRLKDAKLISDKRAVKLTMKEEAKYLGAATVYTLDNELLDIIIPSIKRQKVGQFIKAFWNANPPHKNFYLEWDHYYVMEKLGELMHPDSLLPLPVTNMRCGVHSRACPPRECTSMGNGLHKVKMPSGQRHSFYALCNSNLVSHKKVTLSPKELTTFNGESIQTMFERASQEGPDSKSNFAYTFNCGPELWKAWLDISDEDMNQHEGLMELVYSTIPSLKAGFSTSNTPTTLRNYRDENPPVEILEGFAGFEFPAFQIFIGALSLLNFDWVTTEDSGISDRGTKSIRTQAQWPSEQYKTIVINLPKDKAIAEFHKQKIRTRKFGTADHIVRGHWRLYKKTGERVWIKEHHRGDEEFGTVHKDYVLTKRDGYLK